MASTTPCRLPSCRARSYEPVQFQEQGYNTAYAHPPGYYAVSGVGGRILAALPGVGSPVTGTRLMGAVWLGGALIALWYALGDLGVRPRTRVPALVLMASAPTVLLSAATVTPDSTAVAIGAVALLVVLRWEAGRASPWLLAVVGTAAVLTKATSIVAVGAGALYIVVRWLQSRRAAPSGPPAEEGAAADGAAEEAVHGGDGARTDIRSVVVALAMLAGSVLVVAMAWSGVTEAIARVDHSEIPMAQRFEVDGITIDEVIDNVTSGVSPLHDPYLPAVEDSRPVRLAVTFADRFLLAGLVAALIISVAGSRLRALAGVTLVSFVALGPFFVLFDYYATQGYFPIPARYGLPLVPFAVGAVAVACDRNRAGRGLLWGVGTLSFLATVTALL